MLTVEVNSRRKVFVSMEDDTRPNLGGYYCRIYDDKDMKQFVDHFTITRDSLGGSEDRRKRAMVVANEKVKRMLSRAWR